MKQNNNTKNKIRKRTNKHKIMCAHMKDPIATERYYTKKKKVAIPVFGIG